MYICNTDTVYVHIQTYNYANIHVYIYIYINYIYIYITTFQLTVPVHPPRPPCQRNVISHGALPSDETPGHGSDNFITSPPQGFWTANAGKKRAYVYM